MSKVRDFINCGKVESELTLTRSFKVPDAENEGSYFIAKVEFSVELKKAEDWMRNVDLTPIETPSYVTLSFMGSVDYIKLVNGRKRVERDWCGGQCDDTLLELLNKLSDEQARKCIAEVGHDDLLDLRKILALWQRWHLNDLHAASDRQQAALDKFEEEFGKHLNYDQRCAFLKLVDLYEDRGYKYGHSWLREMVPDDAIDQAAAMFEGFEGCAK